MGWLFSCDPQHTAKDCMDRLCRPEIWSPRSDLIMQRRSFGKLWLLFREKDTGHDVIVLCLVKGPSRDYGAGYKDISEGMGPSEVDCPLSMLHAARAPEGEYAYKWRQKCYAYHERRLAQLKALKPGVWVEYGGKCYQLQKRRTGRGGGGWDALDAHGFPVRMKASQALDAKVFT